MTLGRNDRDRTCFLCAPNAAPYHFGLIPWAKFLLKQNPAMKTAFLGCVSSHNHTHRRRVSLAATTRQWAGVTHLVYCRTQSCSHIFFSNQWDSNPHTLSPYVTSGCEAACMCHILLWFSVGIPGLEPGLHAPKARALTLTLYPVVVVSRLPVYITR